MGWKKSLKALAHPMSIMTGGLMAPMIEQQQKAEEMAKSQQKLQRKTLSLQKQKEDTRLAEATSDVERRKMKMSGAARFGRSSLLGG